MACLYKKKLWENNWCPMTCMYCTFEQESHCEHNKATNADRIRAMSDEELAKWLLDVMSHKVACFGEGAFQYTPCRNTEHDCVKCGVSWLKQPAEKGD